MTSLTMTTGQAIAMSSRPLSPFDLELDLHVYIYLN
jgi:hypothetical protein